jgi:predicted nucleic-acid-binding protein
VIASLDTNVLVRLFISENPAQTAAAEACLKRYDELGVSDVALIETLYTLADWYKLGRPMAISCAESLLQHPKIRADYNLFHKVLRLYETHPALSIEDCYLAVRAHIDDAVPLLTFDKKLANQLPYAELLTV